MKKEGFIWKESRMNSLQRTQCRKWKSLQELAEKCWTSLMIGRQPNKRMVDGAGDFVALDAGEDHPNSHEMEEDYDSAVYILNEKTQV